MRIHRDLQGFMRIRKTLGENLWGFMRGFMRLWQRIHEDLWEFARLWKRIGKDS